MCSKNCSDSLRRRDQKCITKLSGRSSMYHSISENSGFWCQNKFIEARTKILVGISIWIKWSYFNQTMHTRLSTKSWRLTQSWKKRSGFQILTPMFKGCVIVVTLFKSYAIGFTVCEVCTFLLCPSGSVKHYGV